MSSDSRFYCAICDRYFMSKDVRDMHIQWTASHPKCDPCNKRFLNGYSLRQHQEHQCPHNPRTDGKLTTLMPEDQYCAYDACDFDYASDEDDESDTDSIAGDFYVGPEEARPAAIVRVEYPESLSVADRIAQLMKGTHQPLTPEKRSREPFCRLCQKSAVEVTATRCGHLFCASCIDKKLGEEKACPECRTPAFKKQLRKIFLMSY